MPRAVPRAVPFIRVCVHKQWGVLRDDYLLGAKMKDWNRVDHERATEGAAGRGYDDVEDAAWNAAGFDALGTDSDDDSVGDEDGSGDAASAVSSED